VREADGLAISSRNAYLSERERRSAPNLHAALQWVREQLAGGEKDIGAALAPARKHLPPLREDYLAVVHPDVFKPLQLAPPSTALLVIGAAFAGGTRLIDNLKVQTPTKQE
jgi:pantoate--beta-alanine ligase